MSDFPGRPSQAVESNGSNISTTPLSGGATFTGDAERSDYPDTAAPYDAMRVRSVITGLEGGAIHVFGDTQVPFGPFVGPCDVGFFAKVSSGTGDISAEFEIFLIDEV